MIFNEANTVEALIRDLLCGGLTKYTADPVRSSDFSHSAQLP